MDERLLNIASQFVIKGDITDIIECGHGHINKTFKVITTEREYVLQRINNVVFPKIKELMNNLVIVTDHLLENNVFTLKFKPTKAGSLFYETDDGYYRIYKYISNVEVIEGSCDLPTIVKFGSAFGDFHKNLSDIDPNSLYEVIKGFHNPPSRYAALYASIIEDKEGRRKEVEDLIKFVDEEKYNIGIIEQHIKTGEVPVRVVHNDPKVNNILFDEQTHDVKCVIDLDTVMPGSVLYDFGDAMRSLYTGANEDTEDLDKIVVDPAIFKAFFEGYYSKMKDVLNEKEKELIAEAPYCLAMELGIRFLKDYLDGDIYFAVKKDKHNLYRAKTQFRLAMKLKERTKEFKEIVKQIIG